LTTPSNSYCTGSRHLDQAWSDPVQAVYDDGWYEKGVKSTDAQFKAIPVTAHDWHGERNYTIAA